MHRRLGLTAVLASLPLLAQAAAPAPHLRGIAARIDGDTVTVHTDEGKDVTVQLTPSTKFAEIHKSNLSAIGPDTYIGTATKAAPGSSRLVALEVVVFPNAMRGTGEGHYGWDPLPDPTATGGGTVASTMTNGTVSEESGSAGKVESTMTNGTVASSDSANGAKELTVTYKGGEQRILVPPTAPVVTISPGSRSDLKQGDSIVVTEVKDSHDAASVAIGMDGAKPPM
jgi:hypothetical protein